MSAQIIQFPRPHRSEEERLYAQFKARSEARLSADPVARECLARAQKKVASLAEREQR